MRFINLKLVTSFFFLNFFFSASIHLILFNAIQFFTLQSILKNVQRASSEKNKEGVPVIIYNVTAVDYRESLNGDNSE